MKTIVAVMLALAIATLATSAAFAVEGDRGFYYAESHEMPVLNEVLIRLIEASVKKDPSGNTLISAANCAGQPGRRGCATPRHFLEAYREIPELKGKVKLDNFDDLLKFIRELIEIDTPAGTYEVASLRPDSNGSAGYRVVTDGVKRAFEPGEKAWVYEYEVKMADSRVVKIQVVVMTSKCANVVRRKIALKIEIIGGTPGCYELAFDAPIGGYVSWGIGTTTGPFSPSECNAQKEGDGSWKAWYGICPDCDLPAVYLDYMRKDLGPGVQIPHKHRYPVIQTKQVIRFGADVLNAEVYICLTDANGKQTCGVVIMRPQDWKGRHRVEVPTGIWMWEGDIRCPPQ